MNQSDQWGRKISLVLVRGGEGLDLSAFRIKFETQNADVQTPNSCKVTVYNLAAQTIREITGKGEYTDLVLSAGYETGNFGTIFRGTIKQFKIGRENATTTYLEIYASDGDIGYNQGIVNKTLAAGATPKDALKATAEAMPGLGKDFGSLTITKQNIPNIRGSVLFGMARARMRDITTYLDAGWSIQDGQVVVTDNTGYRDGEAVEINVATGMVGVPEQTDGGVRVTCLLNSRIRVGGRIKLNNQEIATLLQRDQNAAPIAYNEWAGFQYNAALSADGMYRTFVVEHLGDTRGNAWYTVLTCLAVNETTAKNASVAPE